MDTQHLLLLASGVIVAAILLYFIIAFKRSKRKQQIAPETAAPTYLLSLLHSGLSKTRTALLSNLEPLFTQGQTISPETLEHLHEVLYRADIGAATADKLVAHVKSAYARDKEVAWPEIKTLLQEKITELLRSTPQEASLNYPAEGPLVVLVVGVNGVGKTTSIGKLAAHFIGQNKKVLLCAADTYRAAAIDQLKVWGERLGIETIAQQQGSDPAAVAFDAVNAAVKRAYDVVFIDTAGRLHNKNNLMAELDKIKRVVGKALVGAPHETWLIVDATTGQNAVQQVKAFKEVAHISGIVVTKLDGTAKGGILIGISDEFSLPIRFVGIGEKASDLRSFDAKEYAAGIFE
jgi:fused signal recognition particle receptor